MPRSASYLSRLVTADEPPGRARAPYRRGWGARGVPADEMPPSSREQSDSPTTSFGREPAASRPSAPPTDAAQAKPNTAPRTIGDVNGSRKVRQAPRRPPPAAAAERHSPPTAQRPAATPPATPGAAERATPDPAIGRATARRRIGRAGEKTGPVPVIPAAATRPAEPTEGRGGARVPRPAARESAQAGVPPRARVVQPAAQVTASLPRAGADRRARSATPPVAVPAIRIGTIDVHVAAPPVPAPVAHLAPSLVASRSPADSERLSRPAAVFGLAQG